MPLIMRNSDNLRQLLPGPLEQINYAMLPIIRPIMPSVITTHWYDINHRAVTSRLIMQHRNTVAASWSEMATQHLDIRQ